LIDPGQIYPVLLMPKILSGKVEALTKSSQLFADFSRPKRRPTDAMRLIGLSAISK
jgi:hypothetical protein